MSGEVEEFRETGGCQVVECLERHDEDFVLDAEMYRKPMPAGCLIGKLR